MKIDKTFQIKEKYFNYFVKYGMASTNLKPFELRSERLEPNSIVKLECENGKSLIFRSGECFRVINSDWEIFKFFARIFKWGWVDDFVKDYFFKKKPYLIEIAEILEIK